MERDGPSRLFMKHSRPRIPLEDSNVAIVLLPRSSSSARVLMAYTLISKLCRRPGPKVG